MEINNQLYNNIRQLLSSARSKSVQTINSIMVQAYYEIGRLIVEDQQSGKSRARYGLKVLKEISIKLTKEFGRGFSVETLDRMRKFYLVYSKSSTLLTKSRKSSTILSKYNNKLLLPRVLQNRNLSWSHYIFLMRLESIEREFYEKECSINNWSLRELKRQFNSALFERVVLSKDKKTVLKQNLKRYHTPEKPEDIIKDPYVLELGKGFSFVGRQQRFTFDEQHFFVDLVFYNRLLRCFVILDIKTSKLTHQDLGQMQMYVNYYDRFIRKEDESKTIGILLCKAKNDTLVEITLPEDSKVYASNYQIYLPTKEELKMQVDSV